MSSDRASAPSGGKGLFLLFEGLGATIIESQVLTHARAMRERGIEMEVWAFAVTREAHRFALSRVEQLRTEHSVSIRVFRGARPALPFSREINAVLLLLRLLPRRKSTAFIHARTDYSAAVAAVLKPFMAFRLIWDARGDTAAEFDEKAAAMPRARRWLAPLKRRAIAGWLSIAARRCDRALFVSEALRQVQAPGIDPSKVLIFPSVADESLFFFDENLRRRARSELGYADDEIVIVYSGSDAWWQCVDETVRLIAEAVESDRRFRGLIVTAQPESFRRRIPESLRARIDVMTCSLREINAKLNAADVAILLRHEHPVNRVASPVKFAEYSLAGLSVVTTDAVEQVFSFGKRLDSVIPPEIERLLDVAKSPDFARAARALQARELLGRQTMTDALAAVYQ